MFEKAYLGYRIAYYHTSVFAVPDLTYFPLSVVLVHSQHGNVPTLFVEVLHLTHNSSDILAIAHSLW